MSQMPPTPAAGSALGIGEVIAPTPTTDPEERTPEIGKIVKYGIAAAIALIVVAITVSMLSRTPNTLGDVAAIIAIVTFAALVIERGIESFWMAVGSLKNAWWPVGDIAREVIRLENRANESMQPTFDQVEKLLDAAKGQTEKFDPADVDEAIAAIKKVKADYDAQRRELKKLVPSNQRVEMIANVGYQALAEVEARAQQFAPTVKDVIAGAKQVTVAANDFVASFKDNPARRSISLFVGALAGMVFCGVAGLDIFAAVNTTTVAEAPKFSLMGFDIPKPHFWGVVATGLIVGLGSAPTHEVIKVLQEAKKKREAENSAQPDSGALGTIVNILPSLATTGAAGGGEVAMLQRAGEAERQAIERLMAEVDDYIKVEEERRPSADDPGVTGRNARRVREGLERQLLSFDEPEPRAPIAIQYSIPGPTSGVQTYSLRRR